MGAALAGSILFLEEVGEEPYRIDRWLTHFVLTGRLSRCAGSSSASSRTAARRTRSFQGTWTWQEVVADRLGKLGVPVLAGSGSGTWPTSRPFPSASWRSWTWRRDPHAPRACGLVKDDEAGTPRDGPSSSSSSSLAARPDLAPGAGAGSRPGPGGLPVVLSTGWRAADGDPPDGVTGIDRLDFRPADPLRDQARRGEVRWYRVLVDLSPFVGQPLAFAVPGIRDVDGGLVRRRQDRRPRGTSRPVRHGSLRPRLYPAPDGPGGCRGPASWSSGSGTGRGRERLSGAPGDRRLDRLERERSLRDQASSSSSARRSSCRCSWSSSPSTREAPPTISSSRASRRPLGLPDAPAIRPGATPPSPLGRLPGPSSSSC
ncbi:MAG: hypothetical protein IPF66_14925, partial [Holophagales bacterium]|nr:hypothetical protein [Holophagales bacterium]